MALPGDNEEPDRASKQPWGSDFRLATAGQILCVVIPVAIWLLPLELAPQTQHAFAILSFMIIAWITQATEYALAGLIGCFLFWALRVVPFDQAFSGFANETTWFLFAALLLGRIAGKSGLARRVAYSIMRALGVGYPSVLFALILTDFLLTFIVPSGIARVVIMASIALALVEAFQAKKGSNIARGMFLILTYTGNIFDKMIIAGAGSITAAGLIARDGGVEVSWAQWLLAFLPCSIVTVLVAWRLTLWFYPPEQPAVASLRAFFQDELDKMGPWSAAQLKSALLVGCAILLWVTDWLHHQSPVLIALGVTLFALLPRIGVLEPEDMRTLNYMPVFFVAAAISMGNVLDATKGVDLLSKAALGWIDPFVGNIFATTAILYWTAFVYHFLLASEISMLATSMPLVMNFAKAHSMNPLQLGLIWTFAAGGKLFAYQSGVLIVGYSYGYFAARDLVRIGAWLTLVEFAVLMVMVPFYWPLIGIR
jgi:solute carrier family 13 (sodium-dependent dicarboxylate transporter), member 2/3/5